MESVEEPRGTIVVALLSRILVVCGLAILLGAGFDHRPHGIQKADAVMGEKDKLPEGLHPVYAGGAHRVLAEELLLREDPVRGDMGQVQRHRGIIVVGNRPVQIVVDDPPHQSQ